MAGRPARVIWESDTDGLDPCWRQPLTALAVILHDSKDKAKGQGPVSPRKPKERAGDGADACYAGDAGAAPNSRSAPDGGGEQVGPGRPLRLGPACARHRMPAALRVWKSEKHSFCPCIRVVEPY